MRTTSKSNVKPLSHHVRLVRQSILFDTWNEAERFAENIALRNLGRVVKYGENRDICDSQVKVVNQGGK